MRKMVQIFFEELKKQSFSIMLLVLGIFIVSQQNKQFYNELRDCHGEQIELLKTTIQDNTKAMEEVSENVKQSNEILQQKF